MGRRDFIRDLNVASEHPPTASIGNLQMDEDGESFSFQYNHGLDRITTFKALMTGKYSLSDSIPWYKRLTRYR